MVPPGPKLAPPLGVLDDGETDPVLHRAAWVDILGLAVDRGPKAGAHPGQADERRPADGLENRLIRLEVLGLAHGVGLLGGHVGCGTAPAE